MKKSKNGKSDARSRESAAAARESDASGRRADAGGRESRRRFAKSVAAAIVAAPVAAAAARAQTPAAPREPKAPPNPQPTPTPRAQTTPPPSPVAKAYAEVARARFGSQVSDEEFKRIERDLEGNVRTAERLRASKLENWDEPDFVFEA